MRGGFLFHSVQIALNRPDRVQHDHQSTVSKSPRIALHDKHHLIGQSPLYSITFHKALLKLLYVFWKEREREIVVVFGLHGIRSTESLSLHFNKLRLVHDSLLCVWRPYYGLSACVPLALQFANLRRDS